MRSRQSLKSKVIVIALLILAGEAVFILPFVLQRVFRPTFLETFAITNTELGFCFSVYGVVALFSYLFGGPLADKFQPKNLMALALVLTALGGIYLATFPSYTQLKFLYGYWGFTTIFLFWAAMIKATRIWGGKNRQGIAFGFLDGGRGLVAALFGALGVLVFSSVIVGDISTSLLAERQAAFKHVIYASSVLVAFIGVLVFLFLKASTEEQDQVNHNLKWKDIKTLLHYRSVWLMMLIILCAYVGYKATDLFSLYASEAMGYNEIASAKVGASMLFLRPVVGVCIGILADRSRASLWLIIGFLLAALSSVMLAFGAVLKGDTVLFIANIACIAIGVYACRVLYFAILEEAHIPLALTGTTVGLVSVIGYTPEIFSGPLFGVLLDHSNKVLGLQQSFLVLAIFSSVGLLASIAFYKLKK